MKTWAWRFLILLFVSVLAPAARWLQWQLSASFGAGDGEISRFAIKHLVNGLPTLCGFIIASLILWWLREYLSNKYVLPSICTFLLMFGVLNYTAAVFLESRPKKGGDDHDHRIPYPFIEFKGSFQSGKHNALGYGGKVPELQKNEQEYRIIFLGGSTVRFGEPPIPALVEQLFHAEGFKQVQVFNFGVSGSNTAMDLARLVFEALAYQPDMIVSYAGGNDINMPVTTDPRPGYPYIFMVKEFNPLHRKQYPWLDMTAYGSHLLRLFGHGYFKEKFTRMQELQREAGWNTRSWQVKIAEVYVQNIATSAKIAKAFDSTFVAFLQPSLLTKENPTKAELEILQSFTVATEQRLGVSHADWKLHDEFVRNLINLRLADLPIPDFQFVDMTTEFDGVEKSTYQDIIHTEQHAKSLLAERIFRTLREVLAADTD